MPASAGSDVCMQEAVEIKGSISRFLMNDAGTMLHYAGLDIRSITSFRYHLNLFSITFRIDVFFRVHIQMHIVFSISNSELMPPPLP